MASFKDFLDQMNGALNGQGGGGASGGGDGQGAQGQGGGPGGVFTMDGKEVNTKREHKPRQPKGTPKSRLLISILITLVFGIVYFWFKLPPLNPQAFEFWGFLFWLCVVFAACMIFLRGSGQAMNGHPIQYFKSNVKVPFYIIVAICVVVVIGTAIGLVIVRPYAYSKLMPIENGDFASEVSEVSWDQIPMLDSTSSNTLADRKLGELSDLVSQFTVSTDSSQINYQNAPVRVNYLDYGNIFKWLNNLRKGIPAYMIVDMRTQEVEVVRLEEGIKYCPSDYFYRNIDRYLRFTHPFMMFDNVNFEIDEEGTPYWVASVCVKRIGLFGGMDVKGAMLVNACTGETTYYDLADVPTWVDRVFSAELIIEQYNYYGTYHNGFWNSLFGQNDCTVATDGYNYIAMDDDVWLYSGITSVSGDRGNIGFILVNQRTKGASYYSCAGAEEYSAMASAEGAVQQYSYDATFPLLLNIDGQPTYFMALKDASSLVKMYAMVNVQQYQIVATGSSLQQCQANYEALLVQNGIVSQATTSQETEAGTATSDASAGIISGAITEIRAASMGGDTLYFFKVTDNDSYFTINARDFPVSVILNVGDTVTISYPAGTTGSIIEGNGITKAS